MEEDVTYYPVDKRTLHRFGWKSLPKKGPLTISIGRSTASPESIDTSLSFTDGDGKLRRGVVCSCYAGHRCGVTARSMDHLAEDMNHPPLQVPQPAKRTVVPLELPLWPTDKPDGADRRANNAPTANALWDLIDDGQAAPRHGIIAVAGSTGSRKTTFAREIARRYLSNLMPYWRGKGERPHVVTYEDPIESWFAYSPEDASRAGFEYTPRQKGLDVVDLGHAVNDALRQKPALLYVNEVRDTNDWESLLYFAGTGHLAITTTHAGSLVETFERIFTAADARTAAKRSEVASRIVAVAHLRNFHGQLMPALWVSSARSRTALIQEGLASLLPTGKAGGCYGRAYFADHLGLNDNARKVAMKWDLGGD